MQVVHKLFFWIPASWKSIMTSHFVVPHQVFPGPLSFFQRLSTWRQRPTLYSFFSHNFTRDFVSFVNGDDILGPCPTMSILVFISITLTFIFHIRLMLSLSTTLHSSRPVRQRDALGAQKLRPYKKEMQPYWISTQQILNITNNRCGGALKSKYFLNMETCRLAKLSPRVLLKWPFKWIIVRA